jgi:hypothetical protein
METSAKDLKDLRKSFGKITKVKTEKKPTVKAEKTPVVPTT